MGVAQLVEHLVVVQDVAGSSPVTHPKHKGLRNLFLGPLVCWAGILAGLGRRSPRATDGSRHSTQEWLSVLLPLAKATDGSRHSPAKSAILGAGITMDTKTEYDRTLMLSKGESDD